MPSITTEITKLAFSTGCRSHQIRIQNKNRSTSIPESCCVRASHRDPERGTSFPCSLYWMLPSLEAEQASSAWTLSSCDPWWETPDWFDQNFDWIGASIRSRRSDGRSYDEVEEEEGHYCCSSAAHRMTCQKRRNNQSNALTFLAGGAFRSTWVIILWTA